MGLTRNAKLRLGLTALLALLSILGFMTWNVQSDWSFILEHRGSRLLAMLLVSVAIGVATLVFQTITHSRILTPSLMGFDVLYVLVHALGLVLWGRVGLAGMPTVVFVLDVLLMVGIALLLFRLLFGDSVRGLHLLILLGMLGGLLFRELADLAMRVLDPTEFSIQQGRSVASFARINLSLLWIALALTVLAAGVVFVLRRRLDVLNLGRDVAINLGVPYRQTVTLLLVVASVLVSVSTALVGPMLFFGLLVTNLAYWITGSHQHRWTLLATVLAAIVCLVGGQLLVEQMLASRLPFVMLLELCGGLLFIALLLRGVKQ